MNPDYLSEALQYLRQDNELPLAEAYTAWCVRHQLELRDDAIELLAQEAAQYLAVVDFFRDES